MALINDKLVFLHTPKTGGTWASSILKSLGCEKIGDTHITFPAIYEFLSEDDLKTRAIITTIRHPVSWYASRWAFRLSTGWDMEHVLDYTCAVNDFNEFVRNACKKFSGGWFRYEMSEFLEKPPRLDYVMRTEYLRTDLKGVLAKLGYECFELIDSTGDLNCSIADGKSSLEFIKYDADTLDMVLTQNKVFIERYYSGQMPWELT